MILYTTLNVLLNGIFILSSQLSVKGGRWSGFVCKLAFIDWLPRFPEKQNFVTSIFFSSDTIKAR